MCVLFMMPAWSAPSELWMQRMIEALEPDVAFVAARKPTEARWNGRIPALAIGDDSPRLWRRMARRANLPIAAKPRRTGIRFVRKAVRSHKVSRILVHYLKFALEFEEVWSCTAKPLFVHCHGYDVTWDIRPHDRLGPPVHAPGYVDSVRRLARKAVLIANSNATARRLFDIGIPSHRVVVKYLGVPVPSRPPKRPTRTEGLNILYLGRLVDFKGPDLVIRAFELACQRGLHGHLTIAGDGPLRMMCEMLRLRSRFSDRIRLLGAVDKETGEKLRAEADIFAAHNCLGPFSHQEEAFGVGVAEAMAYGIPVVSGRSGSLPELITDREEGRLVEPGDIEAQAEAFLELASDPILRRRLGEAAWRKARERFSCEQERAQLRRILGLDAAEADRDAPSRGNQ